jgi:hypothetical protein
VYIKTVSTPNNSRRGHEPGKIRLEAISYRAEVVGYHLTENMIAYPYVCQKAMF